MPKREFPTNRSDLANYLSNFARGLRKFRQQLGVTEADVESAERDAAVYEYLINYAFQLETSRKAFYEYQRDILSGKPGRIPAPPEIVPFDPPHPPVTGLITRARKTTLLVQQLAGFGSEIAATMGMTTSARWRPDPEEIVPTLKVKPLEGGKLSIRVSKHRMDAIRVEFSENYDGPWNLLGTYTRARITDRLPDAVPGRPRQIQIRAKLCLANELVGEWSPIASVVVDS